MVYPKRSILYRELRSDLSACGLFSNLDIHFADFMTRLAKIDSPDVFLAAALVSHVTGLGNICLDLKEYEEKTLPVNAGSNGTKLLSFPSYPDWVDQLMQSGVTGEDHENTPLVISRSGRLYLRRYWDYEQHIIRFIQERSKITLPGLDYDKLVRDLQGLFQPSSPGKTDWQKIAAIMAVTRSFCVISGGPGTGKTTTVARILALLAGQFEDKGKPRILLGAPTGKAASRLQQAITTTGLLQGKVDLPGATTLHRMLGTLPDSPYFKHNADNPLDADIVIVDEASMVDLPLMAKLMQTVPHSTRLILLGDRHQLASVQPGSVLGDICPTEIMECFSKTFRQQVLELSGEALSAQAERTQGVSSAGLQDSFVELVKNYRFPETSGIARLSKAVKAGDGDTALDLLLAEEHGQLTWSEIPAWAELVKKLQDWPGFQHYLAIQQTREPSPVFAALEGHRILCGLRRGPYGMQRINSILLRELGSGKRPGSSAKGSPYDPAPTYLKGQPVMITQNDYSLQLFNGDVGIVLPERKNNERLRVFFRQESGTLRDIPFALLPAHETVFAMTVHKSQGSEFNSVLLILPDQDSPLLTRELLYTAITRAREKIEIWGRKDVFCRAVKRQITRTSGLAEALWGNL